jgi:prepilin-type N-terminal cleavage/methylation domain-containing protein
MMGKLRKIQEGFTIIEVLVVLAIACLIMVIVFIAVPNLQRGQRNEARNNDARLITNAISECLSNRNGVATSCQAIGGNAVVLPTNLNQVTTASYGAGTGSLTNATWVFATTCTADGSGTQGGNARQFAVRYFVETGAGGTSQRCITG